MIQNSIYFLVLLVGLSSCKTEKVALQEGTVLLNYQKPLTIDESTKTVATFTEVADSRCPENVNCIWSGSVTVDLLLDIQSQKSQKAVQLCLYCMAGKDGTKIPPSSDVNLGGEKYKIELQSVTPSPNTEVQKKKEDYVISIKINKV
ncbi:hypothetical protein ACFP1I_19820 [Dyadobacter subterraneus]|uniref:Lipoprotein n=1 Tax=Dyadobacter subterraneus TaxID=2773304 RepID=A0ABR9W627_9BACT|nr:hypothetical protein [Dyadobacter subterraneus]MBE9460898.1 hypothetical protein [Dyadobacter subterraneus]